jgi:acyl-CoA reductase-like NAD-dependent aldehyde dehydrogenase
MKGQPYHYEPVYVSASQRNQVLEECAEVCKKHADVYAMLEQNPTAKAAWAACIDIRDAIKGLKK